MVLVVSLINIKASFSKSVWCSENIFYYDSKTTIQNMPYLSKGSCVRRSHKQYTKEQVASLIKNNNVYRKHLCFLIDGKINENLKPYL